MMTIRYYNNKPEFGGPGPFDADSKEDLVKEMVEYFWEWSADAWYEELAIRKDHGFSESDMGDEAELRFRNQKVVEYKANYLSGLEAIWAGKSRVIFDNGGGITLQLYDGENSWCHHYDRVGFAVDAATEWLMMQTVTGWEGNEEESVFEPGEEEIRNGGYKVWDFCEGNDQLLQLGWNNINEFFELLSER